MSSRKRGAFAPVEVTVCAPYRRPGGRGPSPTDRLHLIPGRRQERLEEALIFLVGMGANAEVARGLLRSGARRLVWCDPDVFDISNMNRQPGYPADRGLFKAHRVAHNLRREAVAGAEITSIALPFPAALAHVAERPAVIACLVDDNHCRLEVQTYGRVLGVPVVTAGLSLDGSRAYALLTLPAADSPCLKCVYPEVQPVVADCAASCIKSVYMVAAQMLHFIDVALMGWPADAEPYNLWEGDLLNRIEGRRAVLRVPHCGCFSRPDSGGSGGAGE